jgi:hypothetical protein
MMLAIAPTAPLNDNSAPCALARAKKLSAEERRESTSKAGPASEAARMTSMTPEKRKEIARKAAAAPWANKK